MSKNEHLIPTAHVAELLQVDVRTVHRMADDGRLTPAVKVPGRTGALLFDKNEVEQLRAARAAEPIAASTS
ncbi:MAG: helix-turn-helix domain-containing protein [Nonomuraea sp.]|nr:helix-turn-helix domain-containing protein [Nonomuraea sp.]